MPTSTAHPTVSYILISYNQAQFIRAACESALVQDGEPMEIIFSDDGSTDETFSIIQDVVKNYSGPHHIILNQNKHNLGLIKHINRVVNMSSGDIIVYAAGDDISIPSRTQRTLDLFKNNPCTLIAHSDVQEIDGQNTVLKTTSPPLREQKMDAFRMSRKYSLVIGATCAWHRSLWSRFGCIDYPRAYEDLIMVFRAILLGGRQSVAYTSEPLVKYRVDSGGLSQGGRNKPSERKNRQLFELKRLNTEIDVCRQRIRDAHTLGNARLIVLLNHELVSLRMFGLVFKRKLGWVNLLKYAIRHKCLISLYASAMYRIRKVL